MFRLVNLFLQVQVRGRSFWKDRLEPEGAGRGRGKALDHTQEHSICKAADYMKTPVSEIEDGIAACFMRKYKLVPERTGKDRPNFHFYESKTGMDRGRYRGSAAVMRIYGDMGKLDLTQLGSIFWGDEKGIIICGFSDVCAMKSRDREKFVVISERKGAYE